MFAGFPAELKRNVLDAFRREPIVDVLARSITAGESDFRDIAMRDQRLAHFIAESGDDVDDSRRKSRALEKFPERKRRNRGKFRRLPHDGIPCGQRRRELPRRQQERRIPRRDRGHHSERLFAREIEYARFVDRDDAAFDFVRKPAEIVEPLRNVFELPAHLGDELAVVGGLDFGKRVGLGRYEFGEAAQAVRRAQWP